MFQDIARPWAGQCPLLSQAMTQLQMTWLQAPTQWTTPLLWALFPGLERALEEPSPLLLAPVLGSSCKHSSHMPLIWAKLTGAPCPTMEHCDPAAPSPCISPQPLPAAGRQNRALESEGWSSGQTALGMVAPSTGLVLSSSVPSPQLHPDFPVPLSLAASTDTESFIWGYVSASRSLEPLKCWLGTPASLAVLLCRAGTSSAFPCPAISQKHGYKTSLGPGAMNRSLFVEVSFGVLGFFGSVFFWFWGGEV